MPYESTEITAESYEANFQYKPLQNPYLFGGDVILTDEQWDIIIEGVCEQIKTQKNQENGSFVPNIGKKSVISSPVSLWRTFPIPYYIKGGVNETAILAGVAEWERETCIRFKREWTVPSGNGLEFIENGG
ncbi:unnamed protein product [Caenorhabditis brenneri]